MPVYFVSAFGLTLASFIILLFPLYYSGSAYFKHYLLTATMPETFPEEMMISPPFLGANACWVRPPLDHSYLGRIQIHLLQLLPLCLHALFRERAQRILELTMSLLLHVQS